MMEPPSRTQRQADAMQHALHDAEYREARGIPEAIAREFHNADVAQGLWGKHRGGPCPKCEERHA